jgi:hypothetical protein
MEGLMRKLTFGGSTATNNINFGSRVETAAWVPVISDVSKGAVDAGGTLTGQGGGGFVVEIAEPTLKHDAATGLSILFHEIHMNITVSMPTMAVSGNYLTASSSYCGEVEGSGLARAISAGIVGACQMAHGAFQGTASAVFEGVFNGILSSGGLDKLLGGPLEIPLDLTNVLNPIFGQIKIKHDAINGLCSFIVRARTRTLARTLARTLCSHPCSHPLLALSLSLSACSPPLGGPGPRAAATARRWSNSSAVSRPQFNSPSPWSSSWASLPCYRAVDVSSRAGRSGRRALPGVPTHPSRLRRLPLCHHPIRRMRQPWRSSSLRYPSPPPLPYHRPWLWRGRQYRCPWQH